MNTYMERDEARYVAQAELELSEHNPHENPPWDEEWELAHHDFCGPPTRAEWEEWEYNEWVYADRMMGDATP